jgi:hypothetical protein
MSKRPQRPRRFKRYAEKGVPQPPCLFCFEEEHVDGRNHDPHLVGSACQKHARELTARRAAARISMRKQDHPVRETIEALRSEGVFFELLAESRFRRASILEEWLKTNENQPRN